MAEVWPWQPNALNETLEFITDVKMARSKEWRDSFKDATHFFNFTHTLVDSEAEKMLAKFKSNAIGQWLVPEWPNVSVVKNVLLQGSTVLDVEVPEAYYVGQDVFVGIDHNRWEQRVVASVGTSDITLVAGLLSDYAGSSIRPVQITPMTLCIAPNGVGFQSYFPNKSVTVQFMSVAPRDLSGNHYTVYAGLPVVTDGAVSFQPLDGGLYQASDLFTSGFGAYALQPVETYTRRRGTVSWYDKGPIGLWRRRTFLHRLRGRDGAFWLPSRQKDLELVNPVVSSVPSLLVKPVDTNANMLGKVIAIIEGDNVVVREVINATSASGGQLLTIVATGVNFSVNAAVCFVAKSRLDSDELSLDYFFASGSLACSCASQVVEVP